MSACEQCWAEAGAIAWSTGRATVDVYNELLDARPTCPHESENPPGGGSSPSNRASECSTPALAADEDSTSSLTAKDEPDTHKARR